MGVQNTAVSRVILSCTLGSISPIVCDVTQKAVLFQSNSSDDLSTDGVLLEVNETIGRLQWLRSAFKIQNES